MKSFKYYLRTAARIRTKSRWSTARGRASSCSRVWITFALGGHRILFRSYTSSVYFGSGTSMSASLLRHRHYHEKKTGKREGDRKRKSEKERERDKHMHRWPDRVHATHIYPHLSRSKWLIECFTCFVHSAEATIKQLSDLIYVNNWFHAIWRR